MSKQNPYAKQISEQEVQLGPEKRAERQVKKEKKSARNSDTEEDEANVIWWGDRRRRRHNSEKTTLAATTLALTIRARTRGKNSKYRKMCECN